MVRRQHGNSQEHVTKHIFVTGGVVSSLGKGLTASSLGRLLRSRGIKVLQQKLDPYINVDPGTMNPFQHGEGRQIPENRCSNHLLHNKFP